MAINDFWGGRNDINGSLQKCFLQRRITIYYIFIDFIEKMASGLNIVFNKCVNKLNRV